MNEYIPYTAEAAEADHKFLESKRDNRNSKRQPEQNSFERLSEMLHVVHGSANLFNRKGMGHAG